MFHIQASPIALPSPPCASAEKEKIMHSLGILTDIVNNFMCQFDVVKT